MEFWRKLFDTTDFPPRWHCGVWTDGHDWLHILYDLGIWSAYFAIPGILAYFAWRRQDLPFRKIFLLFGAFILLCGTTHLMEAIIFWQPVYRLAGVIKLATAVVSWATVIALVPIIPRVLAMRSPEELEKIVALRNDELSRERDWFATTLASIGDGVITTDVNGLVVTMNGVAETLTGWKEKDAKGIPLTSVFQIVNESSREKVENPAVRALHEGRVVGLANHTVLIAKDGTERNIDDSAAPIKNSSGETSGAVLVFRDITERFKSQEALRRSESQFIQLADAIPQLAWMARPDGHIDWYNSRWYEYTGTNFEKMQGWGWQSVHKPSTLPQVMENWKASLESGQPFDMTFPLRGADGTYRPFLTRVMPFRDEQGHIVRWFGTNTDVSEQLQTQEELRELAARLSEADRRKNEFLATLAHELRNPLAPIRTGLEVMKRTKDDPAIIEEVRQTMERQTVQLISLVDDLLDVSRITRGKLELRKFTVPLADVVQSAVEASRPFIDEANHDLTVNLPGEPITLDGDPHRLAQVLSNLLNNAAKYTPEGGKIRLTAERHDGEVVIAVQDTGIGIPPELQVSIFDMFSQIDQPIEKTYTGLGIGLTLVKSLVAMHGGSVEVSSEGRNRGSEFRVRLPIVEGDAAQPHDQQAEQSRTATAHVSRKVLVVDDNQAAADMLALVVKSQGYEVRTARDGHEAVEMAAEFRPHVVLMDLGMPRMSGYEAARVIRQQPGSDEILLVALTGWGQEEDKQRTKDAGFDHHLVKPAEPAELQRLLERPIRGG